MAIGKAPLNPPNTRNLLYCLFMIRLSENILNLFFIILTRGEIRYTAIKREKRTSMIINKDSRDIYLSITDRFFPGFDIFSYFRYKIYFIRYLSSSILFCFIQNVSYNIEFNFKSQLFASNILFLIIFLKFSLNRSSCFVAAIKSRDISIFSANHI